MKHTPRVFVQGRIAPGPLTIEGDAGKHLTTVLRARPGDEVLLFSGDGREWSATVGEATRSGVLVEVVSLTRIEAPSPVVLEAWVALVRANRFDWMVEKCAEAGADVIRPIITEYTQQSDASTSKVDRWRRIVVEAGEQCGRLYLPVVEPPVPLGKAMNSFAGAIIYGDPEGPPAAKATRLIPSGGHIALVIGPAGGLSRADESLLATRGAVGINLGPHLLRTETAAIAGVVLIRALVG
jgi:16S rRNA (uracil1498-N3)-methyltransferase